MNNSSLKAISYLWFAVGIWLALFSLQNVLVTTGVDPAVIDVPAIAALNKDRASSALLGSLFLTVGLRIMAWIWSEFQKNTADGFGDDEIKSPPLPFEENSRQSSFNLGKISRFAFIYFPAICLVWLLGTVYLGNIYNNNDKINALPYHANPIVSRAVVTAQYFDFTTSQCTLFPDFSDEPACQYRLGGPEGFSYIPLVTDFFPLLFAVYVFTSFRKIFRKYRFSAKS